MSNVVLNILSEFKGKKAFNDATKSTDSLSKSVKNLAKYIGPAVLGAAIVKFGKDSVKAFVDDQKEAAKLANVVKNLGMELSNPSIAAYIDKLTLASGVSDTKLRPALQALLTTTGDLTKSQQLLGQAIDISAGSGVDLNTVAQDLANGYVGITRGLKKYNLGLSAAQLKSMKFVEIQQKLIDTFKGSNAAYLETYAGKMDALKNAADEASKKIGGALIDSIMGLTGSTTVDELIGKIGTLTDDIVGMLDTFTVGFKALVALAPHNLFEVFVPNIDRIQSDLARNAADDARKKMRRTNDKAWANVITPAQAAENKKAAAAAAKRAADLVNAQKKNTAELKKQAALKKDSSIFDMQQIELVAALKGKLSDDEKNRVELQLALLNGNQAAADELSKKILMATDSTGALYKYFLTIGDATIKNPFAFLDIWVKNFQDKLNALKLPDLSLTTKLPDGYTVVPPSSNGGFPGTVLGGITVPSSNASGINLPAGSNGGGTTVNNYFGGSVVTDQKLIDLIMSGTQGASLSGSPSQIGRIAGMFG